MELPHRDMIWVADMQERLSPECRGLRVRHRADTIYLLVMGGRVITMQTGFAMLESAYGEKMNAANVMMKNVVDLLVGAIAYYFFGHWLAYGDGVQWDDENNFDYARWFIQLSYATTAATIDSGAVAGRLHFHAYVVFSIFLTGIIYPLAVRWTWGGGWLDEEGFVDFAGSAIVHMVGAVSALVSAAMLGPRIGRYPDYRGGSRLWRFIVRDHREEKYYRGPIDEVEKAIFIPPRNCSNPVQALFGLFVLVIGFLAFNPGSTFSTVGDADLLAARATVTTLLAASGGAIGCGLWSVAHRTWCITVPDFVTCVLGSMVAICACCHVVTPAVGMLIGCIAAILALAVQGWLDKLQIDDPVGAVAVHGPPGLWGALCVAVFAKPHCLSSLTGLVYGGGAAAWEQLGTQCIGLLALAGATAGYTYVTIILICLIMDFRAERSAELIGLDYFEHGYDDGTYSADQNKMAFLSASPIKRYYHSPITSRSPAKPVNTIGSAESLKSEDQSDVQSTISLQHELTELKQQNRKMAEQIRKMNEELQRPHQRMNAILRLMEARDQAPHDHPHGALHVVHQLVDALAADHRPPDPPGGIGDGSPGSTHSSSGPVHRTMRPVAEESYGKSTSV